MSTEPTPPSSSESSSQADPDVQTGADSQAGTDPQAGAAAGEAAPEIAVEPPPADAERHPFGAETRRLLDIVIHSLYTDREVFIRELVSNAADALEKMRHRQLTESDVTDPGLPLEIRISTDDTAGTITIQDHGIGMTRAELADNLGTIAKSGTLAFVEGLKEKGDSAANLIGQFGVGFYSVFMVAERVDVFTRSWQADGEHLRWSSDGHSGYTITDAPGQQRGCRLVIKLKDDSREFASADRLKSVLLRYSNFVGFPIHLNGTRVNEVEALWLKGKNEISDEQHEAFYKFTSHDFEGPAWHLHFSADAPLQIHALLYVPKHNREWPGMGMLEPGVALYCRRVLIDSSPKGLLPEWLRFVRGVIDSEDLPLSISREAMQDHALVRKIGNVVAGRLLKFLDKEARDKPEAYDDFYRQFHRFLKEGLCSDFERRESISKLLRFESSMTDAGKQTGLQEYVDRMPEHQDTIYYQVGSDRGSIEAGPYLEAFKARGLEVLFLTDSIDPYVAEHLGEFAGRKFAAVDQTGLELPGEAAPDAGGDEQVEPLTGERLTGFCKWLKETLGESVGAVRDSSRLVSRPLMAVRSEGAIPPQMRHMMAAMNPDAALPAEPAADLEVNPRHRLVAALDRLRERDAGLAGQLAEQLRDGALLAAGVLTEPQAMVGRMETLLAELADRGAGER